MPMMAISSARFLPVQGLSDYYISPTGSDSNPGTLAQPWAITAIWTKASTYKEHTLEVANGDYSPYNGTIVLSNNDCALYVPAAAAGTTVARTIIRTATPLGAIIRGNGGSSNPWATRAGVAVQIDAQYVDFQGFEVREVWGKGIQASVANVRALSCWVHDVDRATYAAGNPDQGDNTCGVRTDAAADNFVLRYTRVNDIRNGDRSINETAVELYNAPNAIIEYNDLSDATTLVYLKQSADDAEVRYNWIHDGENAVLANNNNQFPFKIHHNVIAGATTIIYNGITEIEVAGTKFYQNTIAFTVSCRTGMLMRATAGNVDDCYENLFIFDGGSVAGTDGYETMNGAAAAFGILDYNMYPATATFTSPNGTPRTFAAWKSTTGKDANALSANAILLAGGSGPYRYKLDSSSSGYQDGRVGGVGAGAICNRGAFESAGQTEQIGAT